MGTAGRARDSLRHLRGRRGLALRSRRGRVGRTAHRYPAHGHDVHRDGVRPGRAIGRASSCGRGLRVRAAGAGAAGGVHDGDGDPDRVYARPGGRRHLYRGIHGYAHRIWWAHRVPLVLPGLCWHPPLRRRGGAQGDVRDHGHGRRGDRGVRDRHDPAVRGGQPVQHRPDERGRRELVPAVRLGGHLGGVSVRDLVFLAIEGVPLAAEETRDPATDMPKGLIAGMAALLLFAMLILVFGLGGEVRRRSQATRCWRPLRAAPGAGGGLRRHQRARHLRQHRGARGADRELLLDHLRLLAPDSSPCPGPATCRGSSRSPGGRRTPWVALVVPAVIGFLLSLTGAGRPCSTPQSSARRSPTS